MKYALLIYSAPGSSPLPDAELREAWIGYTRAVQQAGILLGAEQLAGTGTATSVRVLGGERLLTDGPDLDAALDWAARMPNAAFGTAEVRAVRTGMPWQAVLGR